METQSVRVDKKLLKKVKRLIGKSKLPVSAWINEAIANGIQAQTERKKMDAIVKKANREGDMWPEDSAYDEMR